MNADPAVQLRLLDLQAADTALAQLAHRRRSLPELAAIDKLNADALELNNAVIDAETSASDIAEEQRRLEADVETVRARSSRDEARLQAGGLPSRELEGLQHEIATLARRQSNLEDEVLDVMERAEQAQAELVEATAKLDALNADRAEQIERRDAAFAEIDEDVAQRSPVRTGIAAELPADLVTLYDKIRASGATAVALLRQRRCGSCRIELSGSEVGRVRTAEPDAVVRCDNCRAILIRTDESGL